MIIDYKDFDKYLKQSKKRFFIKYFILLSALLILLSFSCYILSWKNNRELQKYLSALNFSQANDYIDSHYFFFFHKKNLKEAKALIQLCKGKKQEAVKYFSKYSPPSIPVYWQNYLDFFIREGDYPASKIYLEYLRRNKDLSQISKFMDYDCVISSIMNNFKSNNNCLKEIKTYSLKQLAFKLSDIETKDKFNWIYDKNGLPLIYKDLKKGEIKYLYDSIAWIKPDFFNLQEKDFFNKIYLTIDVRLQNLAYKSLGKYEGTFILIKKNGELLVALSKSNNEKEKPLIFQLLKPGSIIKIITTSSAMRNKIDLKKIFPLNCQGYIVPYEKVIFYDWIVHNEVNDIVDALAKSCNISFGLLGHYIGKDLLIKELEYFGIKDRIPFEGIELEAGKIIENFKDPIYEYSLGIGDKYILVNPILTALWSLSIINDGISMKPRLIKEKRNLLDSIYEKPQEEIFKKFTNEEYLQLIRDGMIKAVSSEAGTGKRAYLENFKIGLKTGTAGEKFPNYDAVIIGFAPSDKPELAFSLFALKAGKASLEGAKVIKEFFSAAASIK